jgi:hypothetical protein
MRESVMGGEENQAQASSGDRSSSLLAGIVDGLRSHPPLLFALGGAIVLAGLVGLIADQAWLVVVAIALVLVAGLAAWLVGNRPPPTADHRRLEAGELEIGDRATVHSDVGTIGGTASVNSDIRAKGSMVIGRDAVVGSVLGGSPARVDEPPAVPVSTETAPAAGQTERETERPPA